MPLPPALAKKLAKRGIIAPSKVEVIKNTSYKGYEGCPNKYNIFHDCTKFCMIRWKVGVLEPSAPTIKQRERYLKKYPLPTNWREIYDRGCGRFYYWDTRTDVVSWLPPKHPLAKLSFSAAHLREERCHQEHDREILEEKKKHNSEDRDPKKHNYRYKNMFKGRDKEYDMHLDPMDPAAYSDIPKGTWSSGLEAHPKDKPGSKPIIPNVPVYQIKNYYPQTAPHKKK